MNKTEFFYFSPKYGNFGIQNKDFCLFLIRKIEIKLNLKCDKQLMKEKGEK